MKILLILITFSHFCFSQSKTPNEELLSLAKEAFASDKGRKDVNEKDIKIKMIEDHYYGSGIYKVTYSGLGGDYSIDIQVARDVEGEYQTIDCKSSKRLSINRNGEVCEAVHNAFLVKEASKLTKLSDNKKYLMLSTLSGDTITGPDGKVFKLINKTAENIIDEARSISKEKKSRSLKVKKIKKSVEQK